MRKLIAFALVMILALSLLAGCGGGGSSSSSSGGSGGSSSGSGGGAAKPGATYDPDKNPIREVEVPDEPLDLADDSIYFVVIDGVTYNLLDNLTVQDFLDAGYTSGSANEEVEPGFSGGRHSIYKDSYEDGYTYFRLSVYNHTDKKIRMKDCAVYQINYDFDNYLNDPPPEGLLIYTVGNLALGCTREEVIDVFGSGYFRGAASVLLQYEDSALGREWDFHLNESGIVNDISIRVAKYPKR